MGHIVTNFGAKEWLGIIALVCGVIIFFKGMGTKEGGAGGSGNGSSSGSSSSNTTNNSNGGTN